MQFSQGTEAAFETLSYEFVEMFKWNPTLRVPSGDQTTEPGTQERAALTSQMKTSIESKKLAPELQKRLDRKKTRESLGVG